MRIRLSLIGFVVLLGVVLSPAVRAGDKLKGFYAGSGGFSSEVHRTVVLELAADGTAILQQKWHDKDPQTWHAHWKFEKKQVTLIFDPARHNPVPDPLVLNVKGSNLIPATWDLTALGVLGPPQLAPFGGKNPKAGSVAACQSLNTLDPTRDCVTWGSNR